MTETKGPQETAAPEVPSRPAFLFPSTLAPWTIFLSLVFVYHIDGTFIPVNDAVPNVYIPVRLLRAGTFTFTPDEFPFMFIWERDTPRGVVPTGVRNWNQPVDGRPAHELRQAGLLRVREPRYYLTASSRPAAYVGIYGPGAGVGALPLFAIALLFDGTLDRSAARLMQVGKVAAALLVAASAVFLYLAALAFVPPGRAVWPAVAYGLGTCVWTICSQSLWQQSGTVFFLALGAWLLIRGRSPWVTALSGFAFAAAAVCRPPAGFAGLAVAVYLAFAARPRFIAYALGGLVPALLFAAYNVHYMGSPLQVGQLAQATKVALLKTGSRDVWGTPLWEGAAGLLLSPSRGLLPFSPFMAFAFWGIWKACREPAYIILRPLVIGILGMFVTSFKWFDWWGGWSYGYRLIVDTMPLLALFLLPVADRILTRPNLRAATLVLFGWSVLVQFVGAFAYDQSGWNMKGGREVDSPEHRHRLWSVRDNQIFYYIENFNSARRGKVDGVRHLLEGP